MLFVFLFLRARVYGRGSSLPCPRPRPIQSPRSAPQQLWHSTRRSTLPASDFTLQTMEGSRRTLSDSRGHWVLLTFFATWCGPCANEMPSIERLFQSEKARADDTQAHILAVAIEPNAQKVRPFLKKTGTTFPVLIDSTHQVSITYRAQSIPISYMINPQGLIVGVARGARDWSKARPLLDALTGTVSALTPGTGGYQASPTEPVELPRNLTPPNATALLTSDTAQAKRPFVLRVEVNWSGNLREYTLHPPKVSLPEGVVALSTSAHTSSRNGRAVITYDLTLEATSPGDYTLDPVELHYTPSSESNVLSTRIEGPTVLVEVTRYAGLTAMGWLSSTATTALLIALGLAGRWHIKRKKHRAHREPENIAMAYKERLEDARAKRIQGDYLGCLEVLAALDRSMGQSLQRDEKDAYAPPTQSDSDDLEALLERGRYGGTAPPKDVLDRLQRRVERALARLSE